MLNIRSSPTKPPLAIPFSKFAGFPIKEVIPIIGLPEETILYRNESPLRGEESLNDLEIKAGETLTTFVRSTETLCGTTEPVIKKKYWRIEGLDPENNFVCKRDAKIDQVLEKISTTPLGALWLFSAPPASGKSSFARLFRDRCTSYHVVSVSLALFQPSPNTHRKKKAKMEADNQRLGEELVDFVSKNLIFQDGTKRVATNLADLLNNKGFFKEPRNGLIFIVDEAQKIVGHQFADSFFTLLAKRDSLTAQNTFHKVSLFFSTTPLEVVVQPSSNVALSLFSSNYANWDNLEGPPFMYLSLQDTTELVHDFNAHSKNFVVADDVIPLIHDKADGHVGFICSILRYIEENAKTAKFDKAEWLSCRFRKPKFLTDLTRSVRSVTELTAYLNHTEILTECVRLLVSDVPTTDPKAHVYFPLIKCGIVSVQDGHFCFSSAVIKSLVLLDYLYRKTAAVRRVPESPLEFLTILFPLLFSDPIDVQQSQALKKVSMLRESVWVSYISTTARKILPTCAIDPEFSVEGGQVDIKVLNEHEYFIEFLISNFSAPSDAVGKYILRHTERFTPNGTYSSLKNIPCVVVNLTFHSPPPLVELQEGFFGTLYHYVIHPTTPYLAWYLGKQLNKIELPWGKPLQYDPLTKTTILHPHEAYSTLAHGHENCPFGFIFQ